MGPFHAGLSSEVQRRALEYWCSKRSGDGVPSKKAIDPTEIPALLPWLQLHQLTAEGRFYCRLSGTGVVQALGRDTTGCFLDQTVAADWRADREAIFRRVLETGRPLRYEARLFITGREWKQFCRLLLPLASQGTPDIAMSVMSFPAGQPVTKEVDGGASRNVIEMGDAEYAACKAA
jgi:hypothetical protein